LPSGLANAGLLVLINTAIHDSSAGRQISPSPDICRGVYHLTLSASAQTNRVAVVLEKILTALRPRIAEKIRQADLRNPVHGPGSDD
jgi:ABC-type siderophore export system fused ATPase/permease subunit